MDGNRLAQMVFRNHFYIMIGNIFHALWCVRVQSEVRVNNSSAESASRSPGARRLSQGGRAAQRL